MYDVSTDFSSRSGSDHDHDTDLALWTRPEPGQRKPRFSRDKIAAAAVRIADAEGIEAVSMRRVAAELGAGTMTLYHYVSTKSELFALLTDAVIGENIVPADEMPEEWKAAVTVIARRTRAALSRHPWVYDIVEQPGIGPNGIRHFEQSLQAVSTLGPSLAERMNVISMVDEYVFGFCLRERETLRPSRHHGPQGDRSLDDLLSYLREVVDSGDYPFLAQLVESRGLESVWHEVEDFMNNTDRFDRNLAMLLDGIERGVLDNG